MTLLPVFLFALLRQCPPQESITPCKCISGDSLEVFCSQLQTESQLENALKQLKEYSVSKLMITGLNASTWKKDVFDGLHIQVLDLEKIEVDDASFLPGRRHFLGLEDSLQTLEIKKSFRNGHRSLINLKLDHLSHLSTVGEFNDPPEIGLSLTGKKNVVSTYAQSETKEKARTIILEDNHIPEVGNDWFTTGPAGLTTLIFERNGIEELGDRAFASLSNLKLLAVAGNHLNEISRSVIPRPATQLRTLDLAYNKLRTLPSDLFADMPSLRYVNLDYNLIHVLKEDTFSSVLSQLTALSLEGNPLECDEKLQWVCRSRANVISGKCILSATSNGRTVRQFCEV